MEIKEDHKDLLKRMGIKEEDFKLFDGRFIRYEYDEGKGVRLYDPYYRTSYNEYIDVNGWSSWSYEQDTFMSNILRPAQEEAERREKTSSRPSEEEMGQAIQKKFGKKATSDSQ